MLGQIIMNTLAVKLGSMELNNPLIPASGTFFSVHHMPSNYPVTALGAYLTKTITLDPRKGNEQPRLKECFSGMMNSIGLENQGWKAFEKNDLPGILTLDTRKWISIAGFCADEFVTLTEALEPYPIDAIEVNVSCPNLKAGGTPYCFDPEALQEVVMRVRKASHHFLAVKISIETPGLAKALDIITHEGADAVCIGNTLRGMSVNIETGLPYFKKIFAGYSGPAIKPLALRAIWEARKHLPCFPIIGCGGITDFKDVIEFLMAGANAVEVGTAHFINPFVLQKIQSQLMDYCLEKHMALPSLTNIAHKGGLCN